MIQEFFSASAQSTLRYQIIDGEGPLLIMIHGLGCTGLLDYSQAALMPGTAEKENRTDRLVRCG